MNFKKLLAGVLACCVVCGVLPTVGEKTADNAVITVSAADYTEGTYGNLKYEKYSDFICISGCEGLRETVFEDHIHFHYLVTSIVIPAEIDGLPVTLIEDSAFRDGRGVTSVTIPDSILYIGNSAFAHCSSLESITIPDSVTRIGSGTFAHCSSLESITIPNSVTSIGESAFRGCESLTEIVILDPNCKIDDDAATISNSYYYDEDSNAVHYFDGTICGYENSTAQAYAEKYGYKFETIRESAVKYGDANCDGQVTIADSTAILQALGNPDKYGLSEQGAINADCCDPGDGVLPSDALAIQKLDAKVIAKLPEVTAKK